MKLTKWYYDLVTTDGDVFIGYAVKLHLCNMVLPWRSSFFSINNSSSIRQGLGRFALRYDEADYSLSIPRYDLKGDWQTAIQTQPCQLLNLPQMTIQWQGLSVNASAQVRLADKQLIGKGYVECLNLTFSKAHLPFSKLNWGRFIAHQGATLLVWIQFDGPYGNTLLFDGKHYYSQAMISVDGVSYPAGQLVMTLDKTLLETNIASHVPALLEKLYGGTMVCGKEKKWLSHAILKGHDGREHQGWAVHEEVIW